MSVTDGKDIQPSDLPTPSELQAAWVSVQRTHQEYLARHDVVIPDAKQYHATAKSIWLAVLYHWKDKHPDGIHKDVVARVARRDGDGLKGDQQVRHLKRDGWNIGPKRGVHQLNPYEPSAEFLSLGTRSASRLENATFEEIKKQYGHRCATCGATEGQPDSRYGATRVVLQQGHRDPARDLTPSNTIPQCQYCNRSYKNDFVFDEKGRVRHIASSGPVKRASQPVKEQAFWVLWEELGDAARSPVEWEALERQIRSALGLEVSGDSRD